MRRNPAYSLLDHVRSTANRERLRAAKMQHSDPDDNYTRLAEKSAAKWDEWHIVVAAWIKRDEETING